MNRAIDAGYGWTKFTTSDVRREGERLTVDVGAFQSLPFVARTTLDAAGMGEKPNTLNVRVNGVTYQVSDNPAPIAPKASNRIRGDRYTESDLYAVCMAAAAKSMGVEVFDNLVVGTPVGNFESAKKALQAKFGTGISFDDKTVPIKTLHVVPQPVGGLVWHFFANKRQGELNKHPRLLVDVGYGTLDWVAAHGLTTNTERSGSASYGISNFVDHIATEIKGGNSGIGENLWLYDAIDKMLISGVPFKYKGAEWQRETFLDALERIATEAVQQVIASAGDTGMFHSIVLMGGGGRLYQSALAKAFHPIPIELVAEAQFANVRGFQLLAEHQRHRQA